MPFDRKLNVGAGNDKRPAPWENVDLDDFDAGSRPWPYPNACFSEVYAGCVLPHLPPSFSGRAEDPAHVFVTEAYRVLRPGGVLVVDAPDPRDTESLAAIHHYRIIHPTTFTGYVGKRAPVGGGVKSAVGGPFASMKAEWGRYGPYPHNRRDGRGRPLGVSRVLPAAWRIGSYKLGAFTHLFRRIRLKPMLRGDKIRITLRKGGS